MSSPSPTRERAPVGIGCGDLVLREVDVQARLEGLVAWVELRQVFVNEQAAPVEATYVFPLPDRGAVTGFWLEAAGRRAQGVLREREAARAVYREATEAGQRAALAAEERPDVFTLTVGNVMPGDRVEVRLTLVVPVSCADGEALFRLPLRVAPRYAPLAAPPLSPPVAPGGPGEPRFTCEVILDPTDLGARDLSANLPLVVEALDDGRQRLVLEPDQRLDRDLMVRMTTGGEAVRSALLVEPSDSGDGGHFALHLVPPARHEGEPEAGRDVVIVLDRSGSMEGWRIVTARRAAARLARALGARDRLAVVAFSGTQDTLQLAGNVFLGPADEGNVARAERYLERVQAGGGTEMVAPLQWALRTATQAPGRRAVVVLLTDGQVVNEDEILARLGGDVARVTLCTIGIGAEVAAGLLRRLATAGGGWFEQVESSERLEQVMDRLVARLRAVVADGLALEVAGLIEGSVTPARLPPLHAGLPLVALGRYRGPVPAAARVRARGAGGEPLTLTVRARTTGSTALRSLWGRDRVRDLEDALASGVPLDPERTGGASYEDAIVSASLEGQVLSRLTAFVAVDPERVNPGGRAAPVVVPVTSADDRRSRPVAPLPPLPAAFHEEEMRGNVYYSPRYEPSVEERTRVTAVQAPAGATHTRAGTVKSDMQYLPPEVLLGRPSDRRTTVFSLGLILYEMLTGRLYVRRDRPIAQLAFITRTVPTTVLREPALAHLDPVLVRALQPDPAGRFADASELSEALRACAPDPGDARAALASLARQRGGRELARGRALGEQARRGEGVERLGPLRLVARVDGGGDTSVWVGGAPAAGGFEPVEVHRFGPELLDDDEMRRQAEQMPRLVHPAIVELLELVRAGGEEALVFRPSSLLSLRDLLRGGALPPEAAVHVACQLAAAVAFYEREAGPADAPRLSPLRTLNPDHVRVDEQGDCRLVVNTHAIDPALWAPEHGPAPAVEAPWRPLGPRSTPGP